MPATLTVRPWPDPVLDTLGHDPRSLYVETFWLPTLGPTAVLLLRHLAHRFDERPDGLELTVVDTSQALGLGYRDGTSSPLLRCLVRLAQFDLACDGREGNGRRAAKPAAHQPAPRAQAAHRAPGRTRRMGRDPAGR
jgi:hypothetical protein